MPHISFFCKVETTAGPEHTGSEGRRARPSQHHPRVRALVPRPCAWFGVLPAPHSSACSLPLHATAKCASCLARMLKDSFCLLRQPFRPGTPTGAEFILPVTPLARARALAPAEGVVCFHSGPCTCFCCPETLTHLLERVPGAQLSPPSPFAIAQHPGCPHHTPTSGVTFR